MTKSTRKPPTKRTRNNERTQLVKELTEMLTVFYNFKNVRVSTSIPVTQLKTYLDKLEAFERRYEATVFGIYLKVVSKDRTMKFLYDRNHDMYDLVEAYALTHPNVKRQLEKLQKELLAAVIAIRKQVSETQNK